MRWYSVLGFSTELYCYAVLDCLHSFIFASIFRVYCLTEGPTTYITFLPHNLRTIVAFAILPLPKVPAPLPHTSTFWHWCCFRFFTTLSVFRWGPENKYGQATYFKSHGKANGYINNRKQVYIFKSTLSLWSIQKKMCKSSIFAVHRIIYLNFILHNGRLFFSRHIPSLFIQGWLRTSRRNRLCHILQVIFIFFWCDIENAEYIIEDRSLLPFPHSNPHMWPLNFGQWKNTWGLFHRNEVIVQNGIRHYLHAHLHSHHWFTIIRVHQIDVNTFCA